MCCSIKIVSIEGNIGSGKSTLLSNLKSHFKDNQNIVFLKEPVDEWGKIQDENGTTILEKFYADQTKYSFSFQMMAYISRLKLLKDIFKKHKNNNNLIIITERSLYTDKMVFAKMLFDSEKIEKINYQIYLSWFDEFIEDYPVNKIIYVKTSSEVCHKRINIRHRTGENNIPIDYLTECDKYHDQMLLSSDKVCNDIIIFDGINDIYTNTVILDEWISTIQSFLQL